MSQFHSMGIVSMVLSVGSFVAVTALLLQVCGDVSPRAGSGVESVLCGVRRSELSIRVSISSLINTNPRLNFSEHANTPVTTLNYQSRSHGRGAVRFRQLQ